MKKKKSAAVKRKEKGKLRSHPRTKPEKMSLPSKPIIAPVDTHDVPAIDPNIP